MGGCNWTFRPKEKMYIINFDYKKILIKKSV